jgi:hypothetical protein
MKDFIETRIISAVRKLLTERVNEIFQQWEFVVPIIDFGNIGSGYVLSPVISLSSCERTEKERIIRLDAYSMSISLTLREHEDGELYCYGFAYAFEKALGEDITLGGVADRAVITGKKYIPPKKPKCGEGWSLVLSLRITVENEQLEMRNDK